MTEDPSPAPSAASEEERLTEAALADEASPYAVSGAPGGASPWRVVFLLLIGAGALAYVFWKR